MANRVISPSPVRAVVDELGRPSKEAMRFFQTVSERALIVGVGSPESVIEAQQGAIYMDANGTSGSILYVKRDERVGGDRRLGWILV